MKKIILFCFSVAVLSSSCSSDFTDVVPSTNVSEKDIFTDVFRAQNFLNPAYAGVIGTPWTGLEQHTDNLISKGISPLAATVGANSENSPVSGQWRASFARIMHINEFLEKGFEIPVYDVFNEELSKKLRSRIKGEAFGLRAYYKWLLLKNFAGPSAEDQTMLGYPIINDTSLSVENANSIPRNTYAECYDDLMKDLDSAYTFINIMRYEGIDPAEGVQNTSRLSRQAVLALKSRVVLFAASDAYQHITWATAADTIYKAIREMDGVIQPLAEFGDFNNDEDVDHLWRRGFATNGNLESQNYPPSMFGGGTLNPTQNLVDAFPDANGYPINDLNSNYLSTDPYNNRDPRLNKFIFTNGPNDYQPSLDDLEMFEGGQDASGGLISNATRSGYYMKKFLSSAIGFDPDIPGQRASDVKVYPIFTRAGLYLDFAEAAVEAYGIDGKSPTMIFDAKQALQAIRGRPGTAIPNDQYIDIATTEATTFLNLVRNERRIEFAFEGEYFYDKRRWKLPLSEMSRSVRGMVITKNTDGSFNYRPRTVEPRAFEDYMYYNPIPRTEILTSNALIQNEGW